MTATARPVSGRSTVAEAEADVTQACATVEAIRARVAARLDGPGALAVAEYQLEMARRRLDAATTREER